MENSGVSHKSCTNTPFLSTSRSSGRPNVQSNKGSAGLEGVEPRKQRPDCILTRSSSDESVQTLVNPGSKINIQSLDQIEENVEFYKADLEREYEALKDVEDCISEGAAHRNLVPYVRESTCLTLSEMIHWEQEPEKNPPSANANHKSILEDHRSSGQCFQGPALPNQQSMFPTTPGIRTYAAQNAKLYSDTPKPWESFISFEEDEEMEWIQTNRDGTQHLGYPDPGPSRATSLVLHSGRPLPAGKSTQNVVNVELCKYGRPQAPALANFTLPEIQYAHPLPPVRNLRAINAMYPACNSAAYLTDINRPKSNRLQIPDMHAHSYSPSSIYIADTKRGTNRWPQVPVQASFSVPEIPCQRSTDGLHAIEGIRPASNNALHAPDWFSPKLDPIQTPEIYPTSYSSSCKPIQSLHNTKLGTNGRPQEATQHAHFPSSKAEMPKAEMPLRQYVHDKFSSEQDDFRFPLLVPKWFDILDLGDVEIFFAIALVYISFIWVTAICITFICIITVCITVVCIIAVNITMIIFVVIISGWFASVCITSERFAFACIHFGSRKDAEEVEKAEANGRTAADKRCDSLEAGKQRHKGARRKMSSLASALRRNLNGPLKRMYGRFATECPDIEPRPFILDYEVSLDTDRQPKSTLNLYIERLHGIVQRQGEEIAILKAELPPPYSH
ncbi:hypothetical protein BJ912DRAFT_1045389 [Pholiota molesta]|nr:hypothetical protein BJ912DRAFT_1045389 [Pholiota molesta]